MCSTIKVNQDQVSMVALTDESPINDLKRLARSFSNGEFNISIDTTRRDEFGAVSSDFMTAADKLGGMFADLRQVSNELIQSTDKIA